VPTVKEAILTLSDGTSLFELPRDPITFRQILYANKPLADSLLTLLSTDDLKVLMPDFIDLNTTLSMLPTDELRLACCERLDAEWIKARIGNDSDKFISLLTNFADEKYFLKFCKLLGADTFKKMVSNGIPLIKFLMLLKNPDHREIYFNAICLRKPEKIVRNGSQLFNLLSLLPVSSRERIVKSCPFKLQEDLGLFLSNMPYSVKLKFINKSEYIANLEQPHTLLYKRIQDLIKNYVHQEGEGKHLWRLTALEAEAEIAIEHAHQNRVKNPDLAHEYNNHTVNFIIRRMEMTFMDLARRRQSLFAGKEGISMVAAVVNSDITSYHCTRMLANTLHQAYYLFSDLLKKTSFRSNLMMQVATVETLSEYKFSTMNAPIGVKEKIATEIEMEVVKRTASPS
jgi:hypothetical protein